MWISGELAGDAHRQGGKMPSWSILPEAVETTTNYHLLAAGNFDDGFEVAGWSCSLLAGRAMVYCGLDNRSPGPSDWRTGEGSMGSRSVQKEFGQTPSLILARAHRLRPQGNYTLAGSG